MLTTRPAPTPVRSATDDRRLPSSSTRSVSRTTRSPASIAVHCVALEERLQAAKLPSHLPAYGPAEGSMNDAGEAFRRKFAHLRESRAVVGLFKAIFAVEARGGIFLVEDKPVRR